MTKPISCYKECGNTQPSGGVDNICLNCGSSIKNPKRMTKPQRPKPHTRPEMIMPDPYIVAILILALIFMIFG